MFKNVSVTKQLPLAIHLNDSAAFSEYCWQGNELLKEQLYALLSGGSENKQLHLWGSIGSGKSHLLQACCQFVSSQQQSAIYLPLNLLKIYGPEIFERIEDNYLVCIDDLDCIVASKDWEEALFHLYNRIRDNDKTILITTSKDSLSQITFLLPDLRSRLLWGLISHVNELDDDYKIKVLQTSARSRGFNLSDVVCQYLLSRCARNMHDLYDLLNRLDEESLVAQRKITVPFVKSILGI